MKAQTIHEAINVIQGLLDMQNDAMEKMDFEKVVDFGKKHRALRDAALNVKWDLKMALIPILNQKVEVQ